MEDTWLDNSSENATNGATALAEPPKRTYLRKDGNGMHGQLLKNKKTPNVVRELLERSSVSADDRNRFEQELKLSWYYGGLNVACKNTEKGLLIVASGTGAVVSEALKKFSEDELLDVTIVFPETFESQVIRQSRTRPAERIR